MSDFWCSGGLFLDIASSKHLFSGFVTLFSLFSFLFFLFFFTLPFSSFPPVYDPSHPTRAAQLPIRDGVGRSLRFLFVFCRSTFVAYTHLHQLFQPRRFFDRYFASLHRHDATAAIRSCHPYC